MAEPKQLFPVKLSSRAEVDHRREDKPSDDAVSVRTLHIPGKIHDGAVDLRPREVKFDMDVEVTSGPKALSPVGSSVTDSAFSFGNVESESGMPSMVTPSSDLNPPSHPSELPADPAPVEKEDQTTQEADLDIF